MALTALIFLLQINICLEEKEERANIGENFEKNEENLNFNQKYNR